ncbi:MAG: DUF2652 domain-containing protein [Synechococcaceae cyanobacterium]|nr:DUF2652 domain-containing protein [Synechococcaceae cyanobacterium]
MTAGGRQRRVTADRRVREGYFVIADISGYTGFITSTELRHAQGILHDLVHVVIENLNDPLEFVELEGDAVFVYAPGERVSDAEHILTRIETCYGAFTLRREQMVRNSTCDCGACRSVSDLDLKFVAHFGEYVQQITPRGEQLIGTDVVLVHRLLKNRVIESTGIRSYALVTRTFMQASCYGSATSWLAAPTGLGLIAHEEQIDSFGSVATGIADLATTVEGFRQRYRNALDAHPLALEIVTPIQAPVQEVWGYVTHPELRPLWQRDIRSIRIEAGNAGRTGVGWQSHCDHGGYTMHHRIVDWTPYERITMHTDVNGRSPTRPWPCQAEFHFRAESSDACTLTFRVRLRTRSRFRRFLFVLLRPMVRREWQQHFHHLQSLFPLRGAAP